MIYSREEFESLPSLRLPDAAMEERESFEREIDRRLATLAHDAGLTPEQCVGLALWFGLKQGVKAFEIDMPDFESAPTGAVFARNLLFAAVEVEHGGKMKSVELAAKAIALRRRLGIRAPKSGKAHEKELTAMDSEVRKYRMKRHSDMRLAALKLLLTPMSEEACVKAPADLVKRALREQLKLELVRSAARLSGS